jgi:hypothetical protein
MSASDSASASASASAFSFGSGPEPKLLDGSFNNNRTSTSFGGKAMFRGNDAINIHSGRPVQPASKLLNNWFNGNSTHINIGGPRPKAADVHMHMIMPM